MRLPRPARLLAVLALLAFAAPPAFVWAGEGDEPAAKKAAQPAIWIYDKGGDTRALDVTDMSPEIRHALHVQMSANDWVRRSPPKASAPPSTPQPPAKPKAPQGDAKPDSEKSDSEKSDSERDLAELIKRGGKLPEDWRPHGMGPGPFGPGGGPSVGPGLHARPVPASPRALGRLILAYLDVRNDPVKGPIYEAVLRDVATAHAESSLIGALKAAARLADRLRTGLGDPKTAPIYAEIEMLLGDAPSPGAKPSERIFASGRGFRGHDFRGAGEAPKPPKAPAAPFEGPFAGAPTQLGGAPVSYVIVSGSRAPYLLLRGVPKDSTAHAAGLRGGDRIVRIDGKPLDPAGMRRAAKVFTEGGKLTLEVVRRDDKRETLSLLLEKE